MERRSHRGIDRARGLLPCETVIVLCGLVFLAAGAVSAQGYPNRPIRMVVAGSTGGGTDFSVRVPGQKITEALGWAMVMDNRPGAAGNLAHELVAKATPDGYTLLVCAPSLATNPGIYRKLAYDSIRDFAPVTQLNAGYYLLVVPPSLPAKSVKEFIALAKSRKGALKYASPGSGQLGHLGMELLRTMADFEAVHVPYKGDSPALVDVIAGQVDAFFSSMPGGQPHVRSGRLRALAVTAGKRSPRLPDVPTVAESGFPGFEVDGWHGLLAPAGTPAVVINRLHQEFARALRLPEVIERMAESGVEAVGNTPQVFGALLQSEMIKWAKVIKQSGARVE